MPCAFPCDDQENYIFHAFPNIFAFSIHAMYRDSHRFSRVDHVTSKFLFPFSLSQSLADSHIFPLTRVELENWWNLDGACECLERDMLKHMAFQETQQGQREWEKLENSLKKDFWWGFFLNFPDIFWDFSAFRVARVSWKVMRWPEKKHMVPPNSMWFPWQRVKVCSNKSADVHWLDIVGMCW